MDAYHAERRKGRRAYVQAPILIRRVGSREPGPFHELVTKNISLAGVYFETAEEHAYTVNQLVMTSVSVPEPQRREFPFTRVAGRSRVVRVDPIALPNGNTHYGIALEFSNDVTALTATPPLG
ncbi:MAG: PilZ domain-containing protein [Candidatus Omnitrophica bacterium]|nr:PilZ domain-containing protein [Candidatus Omnitrophota bacterium]